MRHQKKIIGVVAFAAGATTAVVVTERRVLRQMDEATPAEGWTPPEFPAGTQTMVPTDDGAELVVAQAGPDDGPVVALVHGLTSNHHDWGLVAQPLVEAGFRVVGINQRGHGGSSVGSDGFGAARLGADMGQVLTALDLNDVTLVGHSMGGVAALALMTLRPETGADRVSRIVPVATLAQATRADRRWVMKLGSTQKYRDLSAHPDHAAAIARLVFGDTPSRSMVDHSLASYERCPHETRVGAAAGLVDYDIRNDLAGIGVPTTVVCGTRDVLTTHRENQAIAEAIPGADFVSIEGAGHLVIWERPGDIVRAIASPISAEQDQARA